MTGATSGAALAGYMIALGFGLGITMSTFTVIVQNQYPAHRLGEVSAGLQFFRSIGGTIGLAIFGTVLNNQFSSSMLNRLPAALKSAAAANPSLLSNPQVLVNPEAKAKLAAGFDKFGPQGHSLFTQFMDAVRGSMDVAIGDLFILAAVITAAGTLVLFLMKEIPLRATHAMPDEEEVEGSSAIGSDDGAVGEAHDGTGMKEPQPEM